MKKRPIPITLPLLLALALGVGATTSALQQEPHPFAQLRDLLPTPNSTRTASGAPGRDYWQQKVDYRIDVALDEDDARITGRERITYHNQSPDPLRYLWVQIDPNIHAPESHAAITSVAPDMNQASFDTLQRLADRAEFDGSATISRVEDLNGLPLTHSIVDTMMRVELPGVLAPGQSFGFEIDWNYLVNNQRKVGGRSGYEDFPDGNRIFEIAQWFPRLAAYTDYTGWQNKQFLGRGEFTLEFGDYQVAITVPDDHVVAATGTLQNPGEVLTQEQQVRLTSAATADRPQFIITPDEARDNESRGTDGTRTWRFAAENVRDFAWASSRKFIWDAMGQMVPGRPTPVLAMSFYPPEAESLWSRYSTQAVAHTLDIYSRHTFSYPYPVAISVNGPVGGMEYPMICFNGPRPESDGTYSKRTKYGLISVVIHEVGHNWFPMVVNSDERQWTWMDEGLNTFVQTLAENSWENDYPSSRSEPRAIASYMASANQVPIMSNSERLLQFGPNAYTKPATGLNILRETIMGRENFDFAFREYARRWMFKRPEPADLFRTLEDASAVDLDWFFRGWFFTTKHTDLAIEGVDHHTIDTRDPDIENARAKQLRDAAPESLSARRNRPLPKRIETFPELLDFYNQYDELDVTEKDLTDYQRYLDGLGPDARAWLESELNYYVVRIVNQGGLVMPVILWFEYQDGSSEEVRVPAEIWQRTPSRVAKLHITPKLVKKVTLDPWLETADTNLANNVYPPEIGEIRTRLQEGRRRDDGSNPMQEANKTSGG